MTNLKPLSIFVLVCASAATIAGCGPKHPETVPVVGSVLLDGKPIAGAAVVFTPGEGEQATGTTDGAGQFQLSTFELNDGALPGEHRVTVAKTSVEPGAQGKITFLVPKKYGNEQTSGLTCNVKAEMPPVSFELVTGAQRAPKLDAEAETPVSEAAESRATN